jgi:hypothetical protein
MAILPAPPSPILAVSGLFSAVCAIEIDANIRKQGTYFQSLENKRLTLWASGISPGFAGFLPLQSATDRT